MQQQIGNQPQILVAYHVIGYLSIHGCSVCSSFKTTTREGKAVLFVTYFLEKKDVMSPSLSMSQQFFNLQFVELHINNPIGPHGYMIFSLSNYTQIITVTILQDYMDIFLVPNQLSNYLTCCSCLGPSILGCLLLNMPAAMLSGCCQECCHCTAAL